MAIRTYKVTLDSKNTIAPEPVFLRQGDKTGAVVIDATLMDNGAPVSLDSLTPMFKANTADGQAVIADSTGFSILDSANGEFTYQVPNALSAVPGKITTAYFSFSDTSGSESTFDVAFIIKKAVDITQAQADDYITIVDGTLQTLQQKIDAMNTDVQTILDAFNQGDFYNKSEVDTKVKGVQDEAATEVKGVQDQVTVNAQIGKTHVGYMSEIIDQLQNGWTVTDPEHTSYRMICTNPDKREALLYINCNGPLSDSTPTIPAFGSTTMFTLKKTVIEALEGPANAFHNYNGWGVQMMSEIHPDTNALGVHSASNTVTNGGGWAIDFICQCQYAEGVVFE